VASKRRYRGFRGLDFFVKWSVGNWAELIALRFCREVLLERLRVTAFRYGYSSGRVPRSLEEFRAIEEERVELEKFGKRPNLLIYDLGFAKEHWGELEGLVRRPDDEVAPLVKEALAAVEVETSLWSAKHAAKRLSFTVKGEDVQPLLSWKEKFKIPVLVFQVFMDELHFALIDTVIREGKLRRYSKTGKATYTYPASPSTRLADIKKVRLEAKLEIDEKGALVVFPMLSGGRFTNLNESAIRQLGEILKAGR
jgi:hypothetical protein